MSFVYEQKMEGELPVDDERCKAAVGDFLDRQCSRDPWKDGWCMQHEPEHAVVIRERLAAQRELR